MDIILEVGKQRRTINENGFKIYATKEELRQMVADIETALSKGLVIGWVGIGTVDDPSTVFPNPGRQDIPVKTWREELTLPS